MEDTANFNLTGEQAAQLSDLIKICVNELHEANEYIARRQEELDALQTETKAIIARMQQRAKEKWNVEADYRSFSATLAFD